MIKLENIIFLVSISVFVLFFAGCPKKAVTPSPDSLTSLEAIGVLEEVRDGFVNKKESVLERNMSPMLKSQTVKELVFDSAEISYEYKLITLKGDNVKVMLTWQGDFKVDKENRINGGTCIFMLTGSPMKIIDIEGANPLTLPR